MNAVFKALNDKTRREILTLLKEKDLNAGEIAEYFKISKPSISHHLDILKRAELILSIKKGQFVIYSINTSVLDELFQWIYNLKEVKHEVSNTKGDSFLDSDTITDPLSDI
ncbi:winged helix-turn-helix transcriptional regulator [Aquimarina sp. MMG016]|nr:winged helix-turn-helix transcriptional regulator [Aquimarina sp. MMG016]